MAASVQVGGTGDRGRRGAPLRSPPLVRGCELARAGTLSFSAPKGLPHLASSRRSTAGLVRPRLSAKESRTALGSYTLCRNHRGGRLITCRDSRVVDGTNTWAEGLKLHFNSTERYPRPTFENPQCIHSSLTFLWMLTLCLNCTSFVIDNFCTILFYTWSLD